MGLVLAVSVAIESMEKVKASRFKLEGVSEDVVFKELPEVIEKYSDKYHLFVGEGIMKYGGSDITYEIIIQELSEGKA